MFSSKKHLDESNTGGGNGSSKIPPYFICPITLEIMAEPTITQCGHMFDKDAIIKWIQNAAHNSACPLCHSKIVEESLAPCFPLKNAIAEYKAKGAAGAPSSDTTGSQDGLTGSKSKFRWLFNKSESKDGGSLDNMSQPNNNKQSTASPKAEKSSAWKKLTGGHVKSMNGKTWSRLTPLLQNWAIIDISKDEYYFGRASNCDQIYNASEISNVHCMLYRVKREGSPDEFDFFVEDKSTNGTYVNGNRVGKGLIASIVDGDEISFGERFCSKLIPKVSAFIDWIFVGDESSHEVRSDMERAKTMTSFFDLIKQDDAGLKVIGIKSEAVRSRILEAVSGWLEKYRFPAYRFETVRKDNTNGSQSISASLASSSPPIVEKERVQSSISPSMDRKKPFDPSVAGTLKHGSSVNSGTLRPSSEVKIRPNENETCEINFDPISYKEDVGNGSAYIFLRRSKGLREVVQVQVKATDKGTLIPGEDLEVFEKTVTMTEGVREIAIEYPWNPSCWEEFTSQIVSFEARIVSGKASMGLAKESFLKIDTGKRFTPPTISKLPSIKALAQKANDGQMPALRETEEKVMPKKSMGAGSNPKLAKTEDDELLARMMDSFPALDPQTIIMTIKQEREMMTPLNDYKLLQDMVAMKLTTITTGDPNALELTNLRMVKAGGGEVDRRVSQPVPHEPAKRSNIPKIKQSILRCELESFILSISCNLVRKLYSIQSIDYNFTHCKSPLMTISTELGRAFLNEIYDEDPQERGLTVNEDVYDYETVVEKFKKYVHQGGPEIRGKITPFDPENVKKGFVYDIALRKSDHHVKMENNHTIVEDLNQFANLPGNVSQCSFYGVFDGHGGYLVSEYLSHHVPLAIAKHPLFLSNLPEALRQSYLKMDDFVCKKNMRDKIKGGSTAVTAILREKDIHVAWAGDARCIVFRRMNNALVAVPLIKPHNPDGPEKSRIIRAGGFVNHIAGKWRVNGRLAVTRSFGDESLKPVVIAEPEIIRYPLAGDEEFLMLSCDGLYDVMDYGDVAERLDTSLKNGIRMGKLAADLVQAGVEFESTDDITVMLIDLSKKYSK